MSTKYILELTEKEAEIVLEALAVSYFYTDDTREGEDTRDTLEDVCIALEDAGVELEN